MGALGQCALAHLNLRSNSITDVGAESLGGVHEQFVETCASTERMPVTGASLSRKQSELKAQRGWLGFSDSTLHSPICIFIELRSEMKASSALRGRLGGCTSLVHLRLERKCDRK